jgi:hypothetical protein
MTKKSKVEEQAKDETAAIEPVDQVVRERIFESCICEYKFNEQEKREIAGRLANGVSELGALEQRKKSLASQIKSEIDAKTASVQLDAEKLRSGFEMRPIECEVVYSDIDGLVRWIRTDTYELAHERPMLPDERQRKLPL